MESFFTQKIHGRGSRHVKMAVKLTNLTNLTILTLLT